uniref:F-box/LRR-repeat protein 15-like leucin rich repeat domain-containing protein n=1 Tax=Rhizophora mucronata TaxID=61149 RepID=A0A2P2KAN5_RHIMU
MDSNRMVDSEKKENKNKNVLDLNSLPSLELSSALGLEDSVSYGAVETESGDFCPKKRRYSAEEKGKGKMDEDHDHDLDLDLSLNLGTGRFGEETIRERINSYNGNLMDASSSIGELQGKEEEKDKIDDLDLNLAFGSYGREPINPEDAILGRESKEFQPRLEGVTRRRRPRTAIGTAQQFADFKPEEGKREEEQQQAENKRQREEVDLCLGFGSYGSELIQEPIEAENANLGRESEESQPRVEQATIRRQSRIDRSIAQGLARFKPEERKPKEELQQIEKKRKREEVDEVSGDPQSPFLLAMESIKSRNSSRNRCLPGMPTPALWVPVTQKESVAKQNAPKLVDLCLDVLGKNADAIVSLELVPDELRHRLSEIVSDRRGIDNHFLGLLSRGCPTEIRVKDISSLQEDAFTKIFGDCDTKHLTVLQLDLCGRCLNDYVVHQTLASSSNRLPALTTISLRGAHRLSDKGLIALASSAPALQSINLIECSLLTSDGIKQLAGCFQSTLKELYIDDCQNIDAMCILPALKELRCLEVLSVAGIQTVNDDFVIEIIEVCGTNIKELVFAQCMKLTDMSLKIVGEKCPNLCALDLSNLNNLTDMSLYYLANGCQSICRLKLCQNRFSDEAIAAFLECSGESLDNLSLNYVHKVGLNTALAIAKCSPNLLHLDLSWCRRLTDEALGLIVDCCVSLKLLKIFGCTQVCIANRKPVM